MFLILQLSKFKFRVFVALQDSKMLVIAWARIHIQVSMLTFPICHPQTYFLSFLACRESTSTTVDGIPNFQHIGQNLAPDFAQNSQGR